MKEETNKLITKCIEEKLIDTSVNCIIRDMRLMDDVIEEIDPEQILYALVYYKTKGVKVQSFQWLMGNMEIPCSLFNAEKKMKLAKGDTHERNRKRIEYKSKAEHRKSDTEYLFTEAG